MLILDSTMSKTIYCLVRAIHGKSYYWQSTPEIFPYSLNIRGDIKITFMLYKQSHKYCIEAEY